jgi:hypothetical protein
VLKAVSKQFVFEKKKLLLKMSERTEKYFSSSPAAIVSGE